VNFLISSLSSFLMQQVSQLVLNWLLTAKQFCLQKRN